MKLPFSFYILFNSIVYFDSFNNAIEIKSDLCMNLLRLGTCFVYMCCSYF